MREFPLGTLYCLKKYLFTFGGWFCIRLQTASNVWGSLDKPTPDYLALKSLTQSM
jgi:hypothetical protein